MHGLITVTDQLVQLRRVRANAVINDIGRPPARNSHAGRCHCGARNPPDAGAEQPPEQPWKGYSAALDVMDPSDQIENRVEGRILAVARDEDFLGGPGLRRQILDDTDEIVHAKERRAAGPIEPRGDGAAVQQFRAHAKHPSRPKTRTDYRTESKN